MADVAGGGLLEEKSHRPGVDRVFHVGVVVVGGKHQHLGPGLGLEDLAGGLEAVEPGHGDVHQHHVRAEFLRHGDRLPPVLRLAHDLQVGIESQHHAESLADDHVVLCQQHGDGIHGISL